jgi:taurine dioxygenase
VSGLDLRAPLAAGVLRELRRVWLEAGVIVVRGQDLSPDELLAFAGQFGEITRYPFLDGLADCPQVIEVVKREHETAAFGGVWHSDTTYLAAPAMATVLLARVTPPAGGDTLFACQTAAFAALSEGMQGMLRRLKGVNSSGKAEITRTREDRLAEAGGGGAGETFEAVHPVVRRHPETGSEALYVNAAHTVRFEGMREAESAPLLAWLFAHQVRPQFTCRVAWAPGTLAMWDNRRLLHLPINDYDGHRRVMHRVSIAGDRPVGAADG